MDRQQLAARFPNMALRHQDVSRYQCEAAVSSEPSMTFDELRSDVARTGNAVGQSLTWSEGRQGEAAHVAGFTGASFTAEQRRLAASAEQQSYRLRTLVIDGRPTLAWREQHAAGDERLILLDRDLLPARLTGLVTFLLTGYPMGDPAPAAPRVIVRSRTHKASAARAQRRSEARALLAGVSDNAAAQQAATGQAATIPLAAGGHLLVTDAGIAFHAASSEHAFSTRKAGSSAAVQKWLSRQRAAWQAAAAVAASEADELAAGQAAAAFELAGQAQQAHADR